MEGQASSPSYSSITDGEKRTYRVFNPNEIVESQEVRPIHQIIYDLPTSPEFVFYEEAAIRHRSVSQNLTFCSGAGYLAGATLGGVKGTFAGIRAAERGDSLKVRTSRVLNAGGHAGRRLGNSLGVMGLIFAGLESGIMHWTGDDGYMSTVAAGLGTGMVYKAAKGPRSAVIAAAIGGLAAGAAVFGKQVAKRYVPI